MPRIAAGDIELYYEISGPEGAPVIAFSNSLGATAEMWEGVAERLDDRYRCLRYDARSHGRSDPFDRPIAVEDLARDLARLLDALGIGQAHIAGLSLGGMTAQAFALLFPERTLSLALMATAAYLPPADFWQMRAAKVRAEGPEGLVDAIMPRWFTAPFHKSNPQDARRMRDCFMMIDRNGYARCCEAIAVMDFRTAIKGIDKPTLVIAGADDPVTPPPMLEELRASIAGAELVVLSNASHILSVEKAEAAATHLAGFIDRLGGAGTPFERGLGIRKSVLGAEYVEGSLAKAGRFAMPWQDFITRYAWGEAWGDTTLPRKTRSMLTLALMIALHHEEEFKLHVRPALRNGVTKEELRALVMHAAIYAGVPASNAAFRWMRDVLGKELD